MTQFQMLARDVLYWHSMATKLHAAAKVIQRDIELQLQRMEEARYEDGTTVSLDQVLAARRRAREARIDVKAAPADAVPAAKD